MNVQHLVLHRIVALPKLVYLKHMKITKFSHSCLSIEMDGAHFLIDPGYYTETPDVSELDAVLITHEHADHFEPEKLKAILAKNPEATVITHTSVGVKLDELGIPYTSIAPGEKIEVKGIPIESYGTEHAIIYGTTSPCQNTGYLIAEKLFMPGDAFYDIPPKPVEVLALPTGGPWMKIAEAIDYAKAIKPKFAFPIHDAMYTESYRQTSIPRWIGTQLETVGTKFVNMTDNSSEEF